MKNSFWPFVLFLFFGLSSSLYSAQSFRIAVQQVAFSSDNDASGKHVYVSSGEDVIIDIGKRKFFFINKVSGEISADFDLVQFALNTDDEGFESYDGLTSHEVKFRLQIQKGYEKLDDLILFDEGSEMVHMQGYVKTFE